MADAADQGGRPLDGNGVWAAGVGVVDGASNGTANGAGHVTADGGTASSATPAAEPTAEPGVTRAAVPAAPGYDPRQLDYRGFSVSDAGRVRGDGILAEEAAEALLYAARIGDAVGYRLGAGSLRSIEVFGKPSAYADVEFHAGSTVTVRGCLAPSGATTEEMTTWLVASRQGQAPGAAAQPSQPSWARST